LISKNCVLGWAGSWLSARLVIARLRHLAATEGLTKDLVQELLVNPGAIDPDVDESDLSLVGLLLCDGQLHHFHFEASFIDVGPRDLACVAGSGKEYLESLLPNFINSLNESGEQSPGLLEATFGLALGGALLQFEHSIGLNLRSYFGGGYEIVILTDDGFSKLGEVTFLFWRVKIVGDYVQFDFPSLVLKQRYIDDILLLRSAHLRLANDGACDLVDHQLHGVPPMYIVDKRPAPPSVADVNFNSPIMCHCIMIESDKGMGLVTIVEGSAGEGGVVFSEKQDGVDIKINEGVMVRMSLEVNARFRANC
jgi:hypothetical protein